MQTIFLRSRGRFLMSLIACALLVSACTVGPDFVAPSTPMTKKYTIEDDDSITGSQHIAHNKKIISDWWRAFQSPALNQVMTQVLADNNDLAATVLLWRKRGKK